MSPSFWLLLLFLLQCRSLPFEAAVVQKSPDTFVRQLWNSILSLVFCTKEVLKAVIFLEIDLIIKRRVSVSCYTSEKEIITSNSLYWKPGNAITFQYADIVCRLTLWQFYYSRT